MKPFNTKITGITLDRNINQKILGMKKLFLILLVLPCLTLFAQEENSTNISLDYQLKCDSVIFNSETKVIEYLGNVSLQSDIIEIEKADKIVLDQTTQEIVVTGFAEFTFDGAIQVESGKENKSVRYKLGEKIAYVE
jgi:lipopolysaccharide assembly outer membrane protein LptD (OstA)